jgi:hypothetical protein
LSKRHRCQLSIHTQSSFYQLLPAYQSPPFKSDSNLYLVVDLYLPHPWISHHPIVVHALSTPLGLSTHIYSTRLLLILIYTVYTFHRILYPINTITTMPTTMLAANRASASPTTSPSGSPQPRNQSTPAHPCPHFGELVHAIFQAYSSSNITNNPTSTSRTRR